MIVYEMKVLPPIIVLIVMISDIKIEREKIVIGLVKKKTRKRCRKKKKGRKVSEYWCMKTCRKHNDC